MAIVQYRHETKGIEVTKTMFAPKKAGVLDAWFKEARKIIPSIPNTKDTDWFIAHGDADLDWIKFELHNSVGERCYVVINRKASGM